MHDGERLQLGAELLGHSAHVRERRHAIDLQQHQRLQLERVSRLPGHGGSL
jgi:hypothetical protein